MSSLVDIPVNPAPALTQGKAALDKVMSESLLLPTTPASRSEERDDYRILLPNFEGPLDLLLHLIRKEQIDIKDIPIAKICESYLEHLEILKQIDVNIAGEFMVMAATLLLIKSVMILPREEGSEEEDPRLPLVAQLIEYEKFKHASQNFDSRPWYLRELYGRPLASVQELMPVETLLDGPIEPVDSYQMLLCLKIALDRTRKPPMNIETDPVSLKEKVAVARSLLEASEVVEFKNLLPNFCRKSDIIVSFMAILELAKLKFIEIIQIENFGHIQLRGVRSLRELNETMLEQY